MANEANPLLDTRFQVPFDSIQPGHVRPAVDALLERSRARLEAIRSVSEARTYDNTMAPLDRATEELELAMSLVGHLEAVATTEALREAYNEVQPRVSEFYASIPLDDGLWQALKRYSETEEAARLAPARGRFLKKTLDDFRRHGAELDGDAKARLKALSVELSKKTTAFAQNVLDATNDFEVVITDEARLSGLPESAREAARESAAAKGIEGGYRFTLQAPSYIAVLTYADDAALREQLYRAYNTRATAPPRDNRALIAEILALRRQKAQLLGYAHFADLNLEDRMAKTGAAAQAFVERLRVATQPYFERENEALARFRRELEGDDAPPLAPWDVGYYAEKLRRQRYDLDEELLRPYFALDDVLRGMFELVRRLYGIEVRRREDVPVYHEDVRFYEVHDAGGALLGAFYADLYPRETKRGGAWMADFITCYEGGPHTAHLGVMCANASPPVGGKPALLTHRDVETLFHEFGHLLHHLLGRARVRSLAGTRVAWDFVELPSMIMENFCWERAALDLFARHYETGAPLPDELFTRLERTRTFRAANAQMRQLGFAAVDLALHIDYDPARDGDVMSYARRVFAPYSPVPLPEDYGMIAGFNHLFASPVGYAAGYYSYKWAEVLEADAFSRFKEAGVFSRQVGDEFRERILARGDEDEPVTLFRSFMGREPELDALLRRSGLVPDAAH